MDFLEPNGWARPKGYANGVSAEGKWVFVAGQIGWNAQQEFESADFVDQVRTALENTRAVLEVAGAKPEHVTRTTWYITDKAEYLARSREVGKALRAVMGDHYPAMAMVQVVALMEDLAKVEIETTAVLTK